MRRDTRKHLIESLYECVSEIGIDNVTLKKLCATAKVTPQVVYNYFSSKESLIQEAFGLIYREFDLTLERKYNSYVFRENRLGLTDLATLFWNEFLDYMINRPKQAVFFNQYRNSSFSSKKYWLAQKDNLQFFNKVFGNDMKVIFHAVREEGYAVLWSIIFDSALNLAIKAAKTGEPVTENMKQSVYLMFKNLENYA